MLKKFFCYLTTNILWKPKYADDRPYFLAFNCSNSNLKLENRFQLSVIQSKYENKLFVAETLDTTNDFYFGIKFAQKCLGYEPFVTIS